MLATMKDKVLLAFITISAVTSSLNSESTSLEGIFDTRIDNVTKKLERNLQNFRRKLHKAGKSHGYHNHDHPLPDLKGKSGKGISISDEHSEFSPSLAIHAPSIQSDDDETLLNGNEYHWKGSGGENTYENYNFVDASSSMKMNQTSPVVHHDDISTSHHHSHHHGKSSKAVNGKSAKGGKSGKVGKAEDAGYDVWYGSWPVAISVVPSLAPSPDEGEKHSLTPSETPKLSPTPSEAPTPCGKAGKECSPSSPEIGSKPQTLPPICATIPCSINGIPVTGVPVPTSSSSDMTTEPSGELTPEPSSTPSITDTTSKSPVSAPSGFSSESPSATTITMPPQSASNNQTFNGTIGEHPSTSAVLSPSPSLLTEPFTPETSEPTVLTTQDTPTWLPTIMPSTTMKTLTTTGTWFQTGKALDIDTYTRARMNDDSIESPETPDSHQSSENNDIPLEFSFVTEASSSSGQSLKLLRFGLFVTMILFQSMLLN